VRFPRKILGHDLSSNHCAGIASKFAEVIVDQNNAIDVVENLIETCKDGENGYRDAAEHVKRSDLKTFFLSQSLERAKFAGELQAELPRLGEHEKKDSGTVKAALHRAWINTKVSLGGGDKAILQWLEQGEDIAKASYEKALSGSLPGNILEIVRRQATSVKKAHDRVRDWRDAAA
jgi:uncharacterized protein (TIGR02284 family)